MQVHIDRELWGKVKEHAIQSFPDECVGFFIGFSLGDFRGTGIVGMYPCKNISKNKRTQSIVSRRQVKKLIKECEKLNKVVNGFFVGQYHSHPTTGSTIQSESDQAVGKRWKAYRFQIILGLKSKKAAVVRKKFYHYDRKAKKWQEGKITVKS